MKLKLTDSIGIGVIDVVGESHYQDALNDLDGEWPNRHGWAVLVPEYGNPYSSSGNAIRVDAIAADKSTATVGYLPSGHGLKDALEALLAKRQIVVVRANLKGIETIGMDIWESKRGLGVPRSLEISTKWEPRADDDEP